MSGGHLANFKKSFKIRAIFGMIFSGLVIFGSAFFIFESNLDNGVAVSLLLAITILASILVGSFLTAILVKPTEKIAQAVFHVSPNEHFVSAPNIDDAGFGKDLVGNLTRQIYDYASVSKNVASETPSNIGSTNIIDQVPVGIIGLDDSGNIKTINKTAVDVFGLNDPVGLPLESQLQVRFVDQGIIDWVKDNKTKAINSQRMWRKADITSSNGSIRSYYDIAGIYRQSHSSGIETLLAFFNHDETFRTEESALNLIALSVHEIRTPLTILRGYIDALSQELDGKLDAQNEQYFERLNTASQNLSTFMSNVLNVVKADQNQLSLPLSEESWQDCLKAMIDGLEERATVRGKTILLNFTQDLPSVAIDKVSINEVITNLVDNAIKYSPAESKTIWVEASIDNDGTVLTTVKDQGVGIPESVIPNLFTKFHRNHRTKNSVAGTGLGLFLSKAIVSAHHGNIWVKSKEGQGTIVGFTVIPFSRLAEFTKDEDNGNDKVTHGWIKNHSMQRR